MKNYKAFFRWLYAAILRLSDERIPPEIVKMRQQELTFIAEFLEKFDEIQEGVDGKPKFNLERLGQYLVDKDLTAPKDSSKNLWYQFLNGDPELRNNPAIIPRYFLLLNTKNYLMTFLTNFRFEKMSLVQQHKHLLAAVNSLFENPCSSFNFQILQQVPVHLVKDLSQLRLSTICYEEKFMMSFIDKHGSYDTLQYAEICLKAEPDPVKKSSFK